MIISKWAKWASTVIFETDSETLWEEGYERKYGIGVEQLIPANMEAFRTEMAAKKDIEIPEMKRSITAFILITVKVGHEYRVMEKLFKTEVMREIHYVNGEFDLIAKIVMQSDLFESDSAIVGEFVHERIRSISAVTRTQTIIPVHSKRKKENWPDWKWCKISGAIFF